MDDSAPWQRFYLGYKERFVDDCCIKLPNGKEVRLKQAPSAKQFQHKQQKGNKRQQQLDKQADPALTGSTVWDGAVVLAQYLSSSSSPLHQYRIERAHRIQGPSGNTCSCQEPADHGCCSNTCGSGVSLSHKPEVQQPLRHDPEDCSVAAIVPQPSRQVDAGQPLQEQLQEQQQHSQAVLPGLTCLELGAGTGAVSLCLLAAGAVDYALLTDIPDMLPHLQSNVEHNSRVLDPQRALVLPLCWASAADVAALQQLGQQQQQRQARWRPQQPAAQLQPPFELIVGSDLIYYSYTPATPHSRLLLQALVQVAGPDSLIFLALSLHHNPEEVNAFLEWAERDWGFQVERVTSGIPPDFVVPDVLVVKLVLRDTRKAAEAAAAAAAGTLQRGDEQ